jgi:hypothetical protein
MLAENKFALTQLYLTFSAFEDIVSDLVLDVGEDVP